MKRFLIVASAFGSAVLLQAGMTAEAAEFCSDDPAIHFVDAAGKSQTVYLTTYGEGLDHAGAVNAQRYSYSVEKTDGGHKTKVRLRVIVPDQSRQHFHVRFVVSTGPNSAGTVLHRHEGDSGHAYALDFETRG